MALIHGPTTDRDRHHHTAHNDSISRAAVPHAIGAGNSGEPVPHAHTPAPPPTAAQLGDENVRPQNFGLQNFVNTSFPLAPMTKGAPGGYQHSPGASPRDPLTSVRPNPGANGAASTVPTMASRSAFPLPPSPQEEQYIQLTRALRELNYREKLSTFSVTTYK